MTYRGYEYDLKGCPMENLWVVGNQPHSQRLGVTNQCFFYPDQVVWGGYDFGWNHVKVRPK